jgi:hypothetical protein
MRPTTEPRLGGVGEEDGLLSFDTTNGFFHLASMFSFNLNREISTLSVGGLTNPRPAQLIFKPPNLTAFEDTHALPFLSAGAVM